MALILAYFPFTGVSDLEMIFLFFYKKPICLKVLIPSVVGGYYSPLVAGLSPL